MNAVTAALAAPLQVLRGLPYVAWITLLAWAMDYLLRRLTQLLFPWYEGAKA